MGRRYRSRMSRFRRLLPPLLLLAANARALIVLPDGRRVHVLRDELAMSEFIVSRVRELASTAISAKGGFSMSMGSGTTVEPLLGLMDEEGVGGLLDLDKFHIFFGNERTEGDKAGKCLEGARRLMSTCKSIHVHPVPMVRAEGAAHLYSEELRAMPRSIVGTRSDSGLPSLDLALLGSGPDGHVASLYPNSSQVLCSPGCDTPYVPAQGKGGITITLDTIMSSRHVIVSAGKSTQSDMVRRCLDRSYHPKDVNYPAGMIASSPGTIVEWLLTEASAMDLLPVL